MWKQVTKNNFAIKMRNCISCLIIFFLSCYSKKENHLTMEQRISVLTIGANNLSAMRKFYEEVLGWKPVAENKDIVFYKMNGFLFSIGKRNELANFIGINPDNWLSCGYFWLQCAYRK